MVIRLGLNDEAKPAEPCPPAPDQVSALDDAIRQLEQLGPELPESALAPKVAAAEISAPRDIAAAVAYWLARYNANSSEAARKIRELAAKEPARVAETVLRMYEEGGWGHAGRFLASLLCSDSRTAAKLCDPSASLDTAINVAKTLTRHEPRFDIRFAKSLLDDDGMAEAARQRGLAVLEKLGSGGRLIHILMQFLRDPDTHVQSKAALMFGQIMSTQAIMDRLMGDKDARVRANFVEGLWNCAAADDRGPLFRRALEDPNNRVAGNALIGLHRLGENRDVVKHVGMMARRAEPLFRATAAWVMGQTGEERYTAVLRHLVRDPDLMVRRNALRSLRRINMASATNTISEAQPGAQASSVA